MASDAERKLPLTRSPGSGFSRGLPDESAGDIGAAAVPAVHAAIAPVWEILPGLGHISKSAGALVSRRRDAIFRRTLALADLIGAYSALLAVVYLRGGAPALRPAAALLAPFVLVLNKVIGLYDRDQHILRKTTIDEAPLLVNMAVFFALVAWLTERLLFQGNLDRRQVFELAVTTFAFVIVGRAVVRAAVLALTRPEQCIILGSASDAERAAERLASSPSVNVDVLGRLALRPDDAPSAQCPSLGDVRSLSEVITSHSVERVIIAPDSHDQEEILGTIRLVKALGIKVSVLPRLLEVVGSSSAFDEVGGITLLGVRQYGLSASSQFLKRVMDLVGSGAGLVLLAPLFLLLALAIKLDSPGPVLFRQRRIGRRGQSFHMFKFRSMARDAEQTKQQLRDQNEAVGGLFKMTSDPRITRVGGFLRRTSLDELPQLLNVLRGQMSLVGPRPLVLDEDLLVEGWQRRRLAVKPGMTGLWQIFGSARIPMQEMVKIDYLYGANWSIWLDIKILLRTLPYVLRCRGL